MTEPKKEGKPEIPDFITDMKADLAKMPIEYFSEIGKIGATWSYLERMMDYVIWKLMSPHLLWLTDVKAPVCVTDQIPNIQRRFDALLSLVRYRGFDETLAKKISSYADRTNEISSRRNRIIHDLWSMNEGKPCRGEISAKKKVVFEEKPVDLKELKQITADIIAHIERFQNIANDIGPFIVKGREESLEKAKEWIKANWGMILALPKKPQ